jgi:hypothetical protein
VESTQLKSGMTWRAFVTSSAAAVMASGLVSDASTATTFAEQPAHRRAAPFRVIIDTDPGVDDALALLGVQSRGGRSATPAGNGGGCGGHEHADSRLRSDVGEHADVPGAARQVRAQCEGRGGCGFGEVFRVVDWALVGEAVGSDPQWRRSAR